MVVKKPQLQVTFGKTATLCMGVATDFSSHPDSKAHGANMGPIWGRQDPGGPHVGPMNIAIWAVYCALNW